jgi:two-component system cell cycle sensor histidine kinase/response regulator CckA
MVKRDAAIILVIDDEPAVLTLTGAILEGEGFRVRLATDGASALASVAQFGPPDLVVTDLTMPGMGGAEVAKRLVARCPDLPILFVSGYSSEDVRLEVGVGSNHFILQKPYTAQDLFEKIAGILSPKEGGQKSTRRS